MKVYILCTQYKRYKRYKRYIRLIIIRYKRYKRYKRLIIIIRCKRLIIIRYKYGLKGKLHICDLYMIFYMIRVRAGTDYVGSWVRDWRGGLG